MASRWPELKFQSSVLCMSIIESTLRQLLSVSLFLFAEGDAEQVFRPQPRRYPLHNRSGENLESRITNMDFYVRVRPLSVIRCYVKLPPPICFKKSRAHEILELDTKYCQT